jgi:hypothetical protein
MPPTPPRKPRSARKSKAEATLERAMAQAAEWLADGTAKKLNTAGKHAGIEAALDIVWYGSEALKRLRSLQDGKGSHHPIGYDAGGDLVDAYTDWSAGEDHGQHVEYDHGADRPGIPLGKRSIGFRVQPKRG